MISRPRLSRQTSPCVAGCCTCPEKALPPSASVIVNTLHVDVVLRDAAVLQYTARVPDTLRGASPGALFAPARRRILQTFSEITDSSSGGLQITPERRRRPRRWLVSGVLDRPFSVTSARNICHRMACETVPWSR